MKNKKIQGSSKILLGIDEAGRGPVIGPMVICGVIIKEEDLPKLVQIGVKDSKLLSSQRREKLKNLIEEIVLKWKIIKISALEIDKFGINYLELKNTAELINEFSPHIAFVDCPTCWCNSYCRKLKTLIKNSGTKIVAENFADRNYPVVSAASILAKVTRDKEIEKISSVYGDVGSGYASDARTIDFLKKCLQADQDLPDFVRKRWKTVERVISSVKKQESLQSKFSKFNKNG